MHPEETTLSEMSQTEEDKYHMVLLICGINKTKLIYTENRLVVIRGESGWGVGERVRGANYMVMDGN